MRKIFGSFIALALLSTPLSAPLGATPPEATVEPEAPPEETIVCGGVMEIDEMLRQITIDLNCGATAITRIQARDYVAGPLFTQGFQTVNFHEARPGLLVDDKSTAWTLLFTY
jgi:hypothetical protein